MLDALASVAISDVELVFDALATLELAAVSDVELVSELQGSENVKEQPPTSLRSGQEVVE